MKSRMLFVMRFTRHLVFGTIMIFTFSIVSKAQVRNVFGWGFPVSSSDVRYNEYQFKKLRELTNPKASINQINWEQVREDFVELQKESDNLSRLTNDSTLLAHKRLSKAVSAIKKRALSLRRNLPLPDLLEKVSTSSSEQLLSQEKLKLLDNLVVRFAGNSVFRQTSVLDVENALQARRDLESIVLLSENLKEQLKNLSKNQTQTAPK